MLYNELFDQKTVVSFGLERFYCINLISDGWDLEFSTPVYLFVENELIKDRSWVHTLRQVANYLQEQHPLDFEKLLDFKTTWSKAKIYSDVEFNQNSVKLDCGLYLSVNHTALHSMWVIRDLLRLYAVDLNDCLLVVHRTPKSEPEDIKSNVETYVKHEFESFLINDKQASLETANKIMNSFKLFNRILERKNGGYCNFFLADSSATLSNCKSAALKDMLNDIKWGGKQLKAAKLYLDFYTTFFRCLLQAYLKMKEVRIRNWFLLNQMEYLLV